MQGTRLGKPVDDLSLALWELAIRDEVSESVTAWFLYALQLKCVSATNRDLPLSYDGQPRVITIVCVVWWCWGIPCLVLTFLQE